MNCTEHPLANVRNINDQTTIVGPSHVVWRLPTVMICL